MTFADRRVRIAVAATGALAAIAAGLLLARSPFLVDAVPYGRQVAFMVAATVAAALVWLQRRPGNRVGVLLLALAVVTSLIALQGAQSAYLHSVGVLVEPIFFLLTYVVVFAFPDGRLTGRAERLILAGITIYFLVAFVPWMFFSPVVAGGAPLAACDPCPANGLMIADRPSIAAGLGTDMVWAVIVLMVATIVCLVVRLAQASRPRRRTLLPVYVPALIVSIPVLVYHGLAAGMFDLDADRVSTVGWVLVYARCALPFGFLLAIGQASLIAGGACRQLLDEIGANPNASQLRDIVAKALDDRSLELVFRAKRADGFVDSQGRPVASAFAPDRRATSFVGSPEEPAAAIWHDPVLDTDPELVRAAGQAIQITLEHGRLADELTATTAELQASRERVVTADDTARRRIQRDLHDGAQQRLIALQIKVALAQELASDDSEIAGQLAEVGYGLEDAVRELQDLARGIHPPVLRDFGLRAALASATQRATPPASLVAEAISRYPMEVETAVYFCCVESLQNVAKHAGHEARAEVRVAERADELHFEIVDDGVGCEIAPAGRAGTGLRNMNERVVAVRGTLTIDSIVGRGTHVRGRIPLLQRR